jgi:transcriptional regulator with XRE-family HTH domain
VQQREYHEGVPLVFRERIAMKFGERLRQLREAAGLTQAGLASASGVGLASIRNYEQGHREPYWDVVFKLARVLGTSCEAFAECVGPLPKPAKGKKPKGK